MELKVQKSISIFDSIDHHLLELIDSLGVSLSPLNYSSIGVISSFLPMSHDIRVLRN